MIEIKAPRKIPPSNDPKIFLAGSIEMGSARRWQESVVGQLKNDAVVILNPRRDDWDSSWTRSKEDPQFREQVEWELDALERSDHVIMYFDPHTRSPISLLELGLYARSKKLFVVCPEGFLRKGNVDLVCEKYEVPQFATLDELIKHVRSLLGD